MYTYSATPTMITAIIDEVDAFSATYLHVVIFTVVTYSVVTVIVFVMWWSFCYRWLCWFTTAIGTISEEIAAFSRI